MEDHTEVPHVFSHDGVDMLPVVLLQPPLSNCGLYLGHPLTMQHSTVFQQVPLMGFATKVVLSPHAKREIEVYRVYI